MSNYKRNPNTNCKICKKAIYKRPIEINRNKGNVFCSQNCYGISCRKEVPCVICGKPMLAGKNKKTCSRSCSNINRVGINYKQNRPHDKVVYQQGLKIRLLLIRGKNCERCGYNKTEILQVHHKDRDRKNNELKNLELICPNCHAEEHYLQDSWLNQLKIKKHGEVA